MSTSQNTAAPAVQELPEWSTLPEVADRYRTSPATVRYWRHIGYGPKGVRVGARVLYPRSEIEAFDREQAERAASGAA